MGEQFVIKIRDRGVRGIDRNLYKNDCDISNPELLALIFNDLIIQFNMPFWKTVDIMKKDKETLFPF